MEITVEKAKKQSPRTYKVDSKTQYKHLQRVLDSAILTQILSGIGDKGYDFTQSIRFYGNKDVALEKWKYLDDANAIAKILGRDVSVIRKHFKKLLLSGLIIPDMETYETYKDLGVKFGLDWKDFFYKENFGGKHLVGSLPPQSFEINHDTLFECFIEVIRDHNRNTSFQIEASKFSGKLLCSGYKPDRETSDTYENAILYIINDIAKSETATDLFTLSIIQLLAYHSHIRQDREGAKFEIKSHPTLRMVILHVICDIKYFLTFTTLQEGGFLLSPTKPILRNYNIKITTQAEDYLLNEVSTDKALMSLFRLIDTIFNYEECEAYLKTYLNSDIFSFGNALRVFIGIGFTIKEMNEVMIGDVTNELYDNMKYHNKGQMSGNRLNEKYSWYDTVNPGIRKIQSTFYKKLIWQDRSKDESIRLAWENLGDLRMTTDYRPIDKIISGKQDVDYKETIVAEILDINAQYLCHLIRNFRGEELRIFDRLRISKDTEDKVKKIIKKYYHQIYGIGSMFWEIPKDMRIALQKVNIEKYEGGSIIVEEGEIELYELCQIVDGEMNKGHSSSGGRDIGTTGKTNVKTKADKKA